MEKYGTYLIYKNKLTGEIKRVIINDQEEMIKLANDNEWYELKEDPEYETKRHNKEN